MSAKKVIQNLAMLAVTFTLILMAIYNEVEIERRIEQQRREAIDQAVRGHANYAKKYYDAMRAGDYDEPRKIQIRK